MRIGLTTSIATAIAIGVLIASGGGPAPGTANIWVDQNGGTCTRSSTAIEYPGVGDTASCASIDAAHAAASCGDTVLIKNGSYGNQTVNNSKSCADTWTVGASRGVTCTSCVQVGVAPGESVSLAGLTTEGADFLVVQRGDGADLNIDGWDIETPASNLAVKDADWSSGVGANFSVVGTHTYDNLAMVGGSISLAIPEGGQPGFRLQTCSSCGPNATIGTDILVDGVNFHDFSTILGGDPHTEIVRIDGGWDRVVIRNNTFTTTGTGMTTTILFFTNLENGAIDPADVTVANNYFGDAGSAFSSIYWHGNVGNCSTYNMFYNTMYDSYGSDASACDSGGPLWSGNLGPKQSYAGCEGTFVKNVWQDDANNACGTDTWVNGSDAGVDSLGLGGSNGFELQSGSPAIQAGETTNCPAADHDGNTRPSPGATNCDAGGYERNE